MNRPALKPPNRKRRSARSARRLGAQQVMQNSVSEQKMRLNQGQALLAPRNISRFAGILVLGLCMWLLYLLFADEAFYVYGADIQGNHLLSNQEIYRAGQIHDQSIFWVNPNQVKENIEAMPNIRTAHIKITLPANIFITVEERQPEIIWQSGNQTWWIDNEGAFVPPRPEAGVEEGRLKIIDQDIKPIEAGGRADPVLIGGAQTVHELRPDVSELLYTQSLGLVYFTPEGWPVYLGRGTDIAEKLVVADAMRTDLTLRNITPAFIDVRNPLRAVYQELQ